MSVKRQYSVYNKIPKQGLVECNASNVEKQIATITTGGGVQVGNKNEPWKWKMSEQIFNAQC